MAEDKLCPNLAVLSVFYMLNKCDLVYLDLSKYPNIWMSCFHSIIKPLRKIGQRIGKADIPVRSVRPFKLQIILRLVHVKRLYANSAVFPAHKIIYVNNFINFISP